MQLKDATRIFGRLGLLLPLTLIFLTAADPAFACPGHTSKVRYRTKSVNTRMVSYMPTTVITYRSPASYRRCGANLYDTRGAKYVAVAQNGSSARFVAVRNYAPPRTRYIAVRNYAPATRYVAVRKVDFDDDDLRYVAVRRDLRRPEAGMRHIAVRSGYREGNGIVAYIDNEPRYVAVRRVVPRTRYVAVRDIDIDDEPRYIAMRTVAPRTRYVAVRNTDSGCTRAVALRSCLDKIETTSVRRVVLRDDDDYVSAKHVVLRDDIDDDDIIESEIDDDDDAYIAVPTSTTKYVKYTPAAYSNGNGATYIAANDFADICSQPVAVRTCRPDAVSARTITYEVSDDDDVDDRAFLHKSGATYVATDDMDDACLSRQVVYTRPEVVTTRAVSYVPVQDVDEDASLMVSEPTYVVNKTTVSQPRWVALDEDERFDDLDPTWVNEVEGSGLGTVSYVPGGDVEIGGQAVSYVPVADVDEFDTQAVGYVPVADVDEVDPQAVSYVPVADVDEMDTHVSYLPVNDTANVEAVSYVPVGDVEDIDTETVSYVPVNNTNVSTVSYVPFRSVDNVSTTYIAADDACPISVSSIDAEPVYVADASTVLVEEVDDELVADLRGTQLIAGRFGYRDGFEDGREAALEGDLYHPENSGDFEKATEGYEDEFGDKTVYKVGYRNSYLDGYRAGFESAA